LPGSMLLPFYPRPHLHNNNNKNQSSHKIFHMEIIMAQIHRFGENLFPNHQIFMIRCSSTT
jgi:hypothetical protein